MAALLGTTARTIGTGILAGAGNKIAQTDKATVIVRGTRFIYATSAGMIGLAWYTAYRNERIAPGDYKFPFPGLTRAQKQFAPDRPDKAYKSPFPVPGGSSPQEIAGGQALLPLTGGGGWEGTEAVVKTLTAPALAMGLKVISEKRDTKGTASGGISDHWTGKKNAFAQDISNGSSPNPTMDRAAIQVMRALGAHYNGTSELVFTTHKGPFRVQVLYRTNTGGNHFNHIHVGVERTG